jgi:hypothetical protein
MAIVVVPLGYIAELYQHVHRKSSVPVSAQPKETA